MAIIPINGPVKVDNSVDGLPSILGHPITYDAKELCTHPNINKWAKYKPVRHSKLFDLTDEERKLFTVNYGLDIPVTLENDYLVMLQDWSYLAPRGGDYNEPYRLGDFRGYNTGAVQLMHLSEPIPFNVINPAASFTLTADTSTSTDTTLGLEDFHDNSIGNLYFAVIIKTPNNQVYIKTASSQVKTGNVSVVLPASAEMFSHTPLQLYYCFCSVMVSTVELLSTVGLVTLKSIPSEVHMHSVSVIRTFGDLITPHFNMISTSPTSGSMQDIQQYYQSSFPQKWLKTSSGNGYLMINVKNNSSSDFLLEKNKMQISVTKIIDGTPGQMNLQPDLYNSSGTSISSISIPANDSINVIIGRTGLFFEDILPFPGTKTDTQVKLVYNYQSSYREWGMTPSILIES